MDSSISIEINQQKQKINDLIKRLEESERKSRKLTSELAEQKHMVDILTKKVEEQNEYKEPIKQREFSIYTQPKSIWGTDK
jgi:hypothetical protein